MECMGLTNGEVIHDIDIGIGAPKGNPRSYFEYQNVEVPFKSLEIGAKYEERRLFFVTLIPGGDATPHWVKPDKEDWWARKYPREWARFKANKRDEIDGTPLSTWIELNSAQVNTFNNIHVFSIEQLASLPDSVLQKFGMGGMVLREKAKKFLEEQSEFKNAKAIKSQNDELKAEIARLRELIEGKAEEEPKPRKPRNSKQAEDVPTDDNSGRSS